MPSPHPVLKAALLRLGSALLVMWLAASATFVALHALPGRIQDILAGDLELPGLKEAISAEWGLDRSLPEQYLDFIVRIAHGDFGSSYVMRQPVSKIIGSQVLPTVTLALLAGALATLIALTLATLTAGRPGPARRLAATLELGSASVPVFWLGILLLMAFSFRLPWFPVSGNEGWRALVLPTLTLALPTAGLLTQVLREAMEKALEQPFVTTVRARGLGELALRLRHVLRHALLPAVTLGGWLVGSLLGGAVITEKVFGRPGLGTVTLNAVLSQDVPVVLAVVLLAAFVYVLVSTALDLLYLAIDPRLQTP